jgi:ferritin-like metal-binding protein YciE
MLNIENLYEELRKAEKAEYKAWKQLQRSLLEYNTDSPQVTRATDRHTAAQQRRLDAVHAVQTFDGT